MKRLCLLTPLIAAACANHAPSQPAPAIGMANPASVYCAKRGGKLEIREERGGARSYCHLPDGRIVDEWELYPADQKATAK